MAIALVLAVAGQARRLISQFCNAKGRKLATEFDEINSSIIVMGDSFMMYRTMKGAAAPVASAADEDSVRSEWNTFLRDQQPRVRPLFRGQTQLGPDRVVFGP